MPFAQDSINNPPATTPPTGTIATSQIAAVELDVRRHELTGGGGLTWMDGPRPCGHVMMQE